ncbi:hypothetical protein L6452_15382 [Arctium lappa]|uniref:Uncharacterized protein n=1 Tax=Arctium lappa TaxID=4217 RepID=A0ACB9CNR1_ARCLA|nr:hypothetical protein L6452_15382 [Arctium lappa]
MASPPLLSKREDYEVLQLYLAINSNTSVLRKPELIGRLAKWSIYLSSYDIEYKPRTTIKSQALVDFIADFSPELDVPTEPVASLDDAIWTLHVDGSSNARGKGCDFRATNNEAGYEALITGMNMAHYLGATRIYVKIDSLLVVNQMNGEFASKDSKMTAYLKVAKGKFEEFQEFSISPIQRNQNIQVDALANLGSTLRQSPFDVVPVIYLATPSIENEVQMIKEEDNWLSDIRRFLTNNSTDDHQQD